ncbi:hypothetical protein [Halalkalibacter nanhaiisediminis]|uniref:Uncharacterized protein n=1 Tax=Halalkalibacter nanhaiisediminis TaxID=688079 RepID=A0A562QGH5_9BACI|nr:hypothetical protein [Halalkalibacter nanhaiisediminis]TWI55844.1 hypothetical protein IQ10_02404 [Halalkalibacter nanhaiisediminis]
MLKSFKNIFNAITKAHAHIPYPLLFTEQFMQTYTGFKDWGALVEAVGLHAPCEEALERAFHEQIHVRTKTCFSSWVEMRQKAEEVYYERHPFGLHPLH